MRRSLLLLVSVLSLVTGSTLFAIAETVRQPALPEPAMTGDSQIAVVRAFYEAANEFLATNDPAVLDPIVALDLVEHPTGLGNNRGRAALIDQLRSRRQLFPRLRFIVDELHTTGADRVTARIHVEAGVPNRFLGLPAPLSLAEWGPLELFRIAEDHIVERWRSQPETLFVSSLGQVTLPYGADVQPRTLVVARLRLAAGAATEVSDPLATTVVFVEDGGACIRVGAESSLSFSSHESMVVLPNEHLAIRNDCDGEVALLEVRLWSLDVSPSSLIRTNSRAAAEGASERVSEVVLLSAFGIAISPPMHLNIDSLVLAADVAVSIAAQNEFLVAIVTDGVLDASLDRGSAIVQTRIKAGDGISAETGAAGTWRAGTGGPVSVVVLTLESSSEAESVARS